MNIPLALRSLSRPALTRYSNALWSGLIVAAGLALLVALRLGWIDILPQQSQLEESSSQQSDTTLPVVELSTEKLAAADLHLATARCEPIQPRRMVPGTITYDAARRLPVIAPVAGVVRTVLVEPGQQVAARQPLAELSSPEVGLARDEVLQRQAEWAIARQEERWAEDVAASVADLVALLAQRPKPDEVEAAFQKRALGEYRHKIVEAYSSLVLAEQVLKGSGELESGTLSRRLVEERQNNRQVAAAQFAAACETARFAALRSRDKARAAAEQAERLLAVAQQRLRNLIGPLADASPVTDRARLSDFVLLSPLAGRVEERKAVEAARVATGDLLFTIADISMLWASAEIHERDWAALDAAVQSQITVLIPALGNAEAPANVRFVGAQISAETRSVPLVAELPNPDGRLKPGMFVWVEVPLGAPHEALVVPAGAIMRHDNQPFVFVPQGERRFRRVDVETGVQTRDRVEILTGLKAGDVVVDRGAFFLKSELLLERGE